MPGVVPGINKSMTACASCQQVIDANRLQTYINVSFKAELRARTQAWENRSLCTTLWYVLILQRLSRR